MKLRYILLLIFLIVVILRFFVLDICKVTGLSMSSTLYPNDWIVFVRKGIFFHNPERFDIHIIKSYQRNLFDFDGFLIKRLVGMPGELISFDDPLVKINGQPIDNPDSVRLNYSIPDSVISFENLVNNIPSNINVDYSRVTSMFILNLSSNDKKELYRLPEIVRRNLTILKNQTSPTNFDHQDLSNSNNDSCQEYPSRSNFRVLPINDQLEPKPNTGIRILSNQYYYLGDNRPGSTDSRSLGSIPEHRIKGKVLFLLFRNCNGRIVMFKSLDKVSQVTVKPQRDNQN